MNTFAVNGNALDEVRRSGSGRTMTFANIEVRVSKVSAIEGRAWSKVLVEADSGIGFKTQWITDTDIAPAPRIGDRFRLSIGAVE